MPFTRPQLHNITRSRGQAYIARDRGNYAFRVCEATIRRKLYAYEDRAVKWEYRQYQQAQRDIRDYALTQDTSGITAAWRRAVLSYSEQRITRLVYDLSAHAAQIATEAYTAGYIGRLWVMDNMTTEDAPVVKSRMIYPPQIDRLAIYQDYESEALVMIARQRTAAAGIVTQALPGAQAARLVADLGASWTAPKRMFARTTALTRSVVMRQSNLGAYYAYLAQSGQVREAEGDAPDWILGMSWLSSRDSRVCSICRRLDGQIWLLTDMLAMALTGLPPDSTHDNCRCTVVPVLVPNFLKGDNEPPDDTFDEWLEANGYGSLLTDFADLPVDSSQV